MILLLTSFLAGCLSVLAPCVIGMLPLLVGFSATEKNYFKVFRVIAGLTLSVFIFSLLLKASTLLITIPTEFWQYISGGVVILFGLTQIFPRIWEEVALKLKLQKTSTALQQKSAKTGGKWGDFILGTSLGPIFSACSPTYALIVATILPASLPKGLLYLFTFVLGLGVTILLLAVLGQKVIRKLGWGINPNGWFKRGLGCLFIIFGLLLVTGLDKVLLTQLVQNGWFDWQVNLESNF